MIKHYNDLSNTYVRFECIINLDDELKELGNKNIFFIDENKYVQESIDALEELKTFESKKKRKYKDSHIKGREAVKLIFLLPRMNLRKKKLLKLRNLIIKYILPKACKLHLTYVERKGKARYLTIIICEREYYKRLKCVYTYAKSDLYKDAIKKCFCSADNVNAVLYKRKGETIKMNKQHFSNTKITCFHKSRSDWSKYLLQLRKLYILCVEQIGVKTARRQVFNKINLAKAKNKYQIWKIQKLNYCITNMNIKIDKAYDVIYCDACYYQHYEVLRGFQEIFHKYRQRLNNSRFHHGRVVLQIGLNTYYKTFNNNIETFENDFIQEIDDYLGYVIENY